MKAIIIGLFLLSLTANAISVPMVIYDEDTRTDYYYLEDSRYKTWAKKTVALISSSRLTEDADGNFELDDTTYGDSVGLCEGVPFKDQVQVAHCSGFLVDYDKIATAGHCISSCDGTQFVFGYRYDDDPDYQEITIPAENVYECDEVIVSVQEGDRDFAVVRLDREVPGYLKPFNLNNSWGGVSEGVPLVLIGYPAGIPLKVADMGKVRSVSDHYFTTTVDAFGGNSGSPVINDVTNEVEGILVRGEQDFSYEGDCAVDNVCLGDDCRGEEVSHISEILDYIED